jgi:hypothetical protein
MAEDPPQSSDPGHPVVGSFEGTAAFDGDVLQQASIWPLATST